MWGNYGGWGCEGVQRFADADGGARLVSDARKRNTVAALSKQHGTFVALKLIHQAADEIRKPLHEGGKRSVVVTRSRRVRGMASKIRLLTDLSVTTAQNFDDVPDWKAELMEKEVLVVTSSVMKKLLQDKEVSMGNFNILVLDSCHSIYCDENLKAIMEFYESTPETAPKPRILGLTYPLFTQDVIGFENKRSSLHKRELFLEDKLSKSNDTADHSSSMERIVVNESNIDIDKQNSPTSVENVNTSEISTIEREGILNNELIAKCNNVLVLTNIDQANTSTNAEIDTQNSSEIVLEMDNEVFKDDSKQNDSNQYIVKDVLSKCDNDDQKINQNDTTNTYSSLESSDFSNDVSLQGNFEITSVYERLECQLGRLETVLSSTTDLVDDIEGMKRFFGRPREVIIEFVSAIDNATQSDDYLYLNKYMRDTVEEAYFFMADHRYDPMEIYGEDLYGDELSHIPDPTMDPKSILDQFIYALDQLGPYGADKAAYNLLMKLEKLKVRIPYERHYLLLCICTTVLVKIRCAADLVFQKYPSELDKIKIFCTPKVHRFAELLKQFKPTSGVGSDSNIKHDQDSDLKLKENNHVKIGDSSKNALGDKSIDKSMNVKCKSNENVQNNACKNLVESHILTEKETKLNISVKNDDNIKDTVDKLSLDKDKLCDDIDKCDFNFLGKQLEWMYDKKLEDVNIENVAETSDNMGVATPKESSNLVSENESFERDSTENAVVNIKKLLIDEKSPGDVTKNVMETIQLIDDTSEISTDSSKAFDSINRRDVTDENSFDNDTNTATIHTMCQSDCLTNPLILITRAGPRYKGRGRHTAGFNNNRARRVNANLKPDALCGIIFVREALMAKALFGIVVELSRWEPDLWFLCAQYSATEKVPDPIKEPKDAEVHRKRQEDVLRKFRMHDCNLLLANSALEEGIEMPRCNLVVRWDPPNGYRSYALCRAKGRASESVAAIFAENVPLECQNKGLSWKKCSVDNVVSDLAVYMELDQMVARRSGSEKKENDSFQEESRADVLSRLIKPYRTEVEGAVVDLNGAIALVNRYCCKLPSDTFTRLAPHWTVESVSMTHRTGTTDNAYVCTLRLPINCPIKYNIVGHPMPSKALARRVAALQTCRILHMSGELDEHLMPIGKENFKTPAWVSAPTPAADLARTNAQRSLGVQDPARPGTTKRRQYYFKKTAWSLSECRPLIKDDSNNKTESQTEESESRTDGRTENVNLLYAICCNLVCPLPERYNTRGRKLHAPESSKQGLAILTSRVIRKIPPFLLYTRSGEVLVCLVHAGNLPPLSTEQAKKAEAFVKFAFADVLRVRRHQMEFVNGDGERTNNYYVVPTVKVPSWDGSFKIEIDWKFLDLIYEHTKKKYAYPLVDSELWTDKSQNDGNTKDQKIGEVSGEDLQKLETESNTDETEEENVPNLRNPLLEPGDVFQFDPEKYRDAVVTPWYRNQDQPQYFFVAEICPHLTPLSSFPSDNHDTFAEYYRGKYGAPITQLQQPLLDVDHTSARLNLLTPRYVNRKGVAMPVSSERTRRAKRDRLDQKQILVPELCLPHPFTGALWSAAVTLPCILYRINSLLIADEIRRSVAISVGLGTADLDDDHRPGFEWPPLDFGFALADVLSKDRDGQEKVRDKEKQEMPEDDSEDAEIGEEWNKLHDKKDKSLNEILQEKIDEENDGFEIGTWSNDMADNVPDWDENLDRRLPDNLTFCPSSSDIQWGAKIEPNSGPSMGRARTFSMADSDVSYMSSDFDSSDDTETDSDTESDQDDDLCHTGGLCKKAGSRSVRIEFKSYHEAEAIDIKPLSEEESGEKSNDDSTDTEDEKQCLREFREYFYGGENCGDPVVEEHIAKFRECVENHKQQILSDGTLIRKDQNIINLMPKDVQNSTVTAVVKNSIDNVQISMKGHDKDFAKESETINMDREVNLNTSNNEHHREENRDKNIEGHVTENESYELERLSNEVNEKKKDKKENITKSNKIVGETGKIVGETDEIVEETDEIVGVTDNIVRGTDEIVGVTDKIVHETDEIVGETDETVGETDEIVGETDEIVEKPNEIFRKTTEFVGKTNNDLLNELFPFVLSNRDDLYHEEWSRNGVISLETIEKNKRKLLNEAKDKISSEKMSNLNCFSMKDVDIDSQNFVDERITNLGYDSDEIYLENVKTRATDCGSGEDLKDACEGGRILKSFGTGRDFDFDFQPVLVGHPGPSPSLILQALTMSNANDGINLERLETIGDSFLKYAITAYLYCAHPNVHEGKLSHMRSKQVSNLNLYRLGGSRKLGPRMIATKFEPHDNWLPPCHRAPTTLVNAATEFYHQHELHNHLHCPIHGNKYINRIGPNVEPCGTPNQTENEISKCESRNVKDMNDKSHSNLEDDRYENNILEDKLEDVDAMEHNVECTCSVKISGNGESNRTLCGRLLDNGSCFIPYNLITQHSIPDKSIADCVEALIGAYLIDCGPRGALIFMSWLGIKVLPKYEVLLDSDHPFVKMMQETELRNCKNIDKSEKSLPNSADSKFKSETLDFKSECSNLESVDSKLKIVNSDSKCVDSDVKSDEEVEIRDYCGNLRSRDEDDDDSVGEKDWIWSGRKPGSLKPSKNEKGQWIQIEFGELKAPPSPLLRYVANPEGELERMLSGYDKLESTLGYRFRDRSLLLQALTHASHRQTALTDCYQRLEFLGDAILDYLITRHLYEDARRHSPGALTDLRSALVNNTIFAALAARHGFHKYFNHMSPGLNEVLERYVRIQEENGHSISEEHYLIEEDDAEQAEDVEVPKALGDLFESIAGAIFLDSGMSLSAVWKVYYDLMAVELEAFSAAVPKSPVRELLEAEPETAKFGKPERLADGRRVRVCVEVFGRGSFAGVGRNYRIAKGTAARCALRHLNDRRKEGGKR